MAPWRRPLEDTIQAHADDPTSKYVQLATNTASGYPAVRTLVFRKLVDDGLLFAIDARSCKVDEIGRDPRAEICWYFAGSREQFRLRGGLVARDGQDQLSFAERAEIWATLSPPVRAQFRWPKPAADWSSEAMNSANRGAELESIPRTFAVLALQVDRVDHLDLKADPFVRLIYERDSSRPNGWQIRRVNP